MIVVSDTSPISGLAIVEKLPIVQALYGQIVIPPAVASELARGGKDDPRIASALDVSWLEIKKPNNLSLISALQNEHRLDRGESEAIALALELKARALLIDERLGRRQASRLGLSITGLIGVLVAAKRQAIVTEMRPVLDDLVSEAGFRISLQLYQEALLAAGEWAEQEEQGE